MPISTHFFPRVAAIVYDALLVVALWFPATALLLPFTDGQAISASSIAFPLYLLAWAYAYFIISWRFGGRTLGMKAWRLQLIDPKQSHRGLSWIASARYAGLASLSWLTLGVGYLLPLLRSDRCSLHELLSGFQVIRLDR